MACLNSFFLFGQSIVDKFPQRRAEQDSSVEIPLPQAAKAAPIHHKSAHSSGLFVTSAHFSRSLKCKIVTHRHVGAMFFLLSCEHDVGARLQILTYGGGSDVGVWLFQTIDCLYSDASCAAICSQMFAIFRGFGPEDGE